MSDPTVICGGDPYVLILIQLLESVRLPLRSGSHAGRLGPQPASKSTSKPRLSVDEKAAEPANPTCTPCAAGI
jgi:hypothetical protein